jgi:hypothetical protein
MAPGRDQTGAMTAPSTSLERTYRYLRLSLVVVVVLISVSIATYIAANRPLGSISAAYYTDPGPVFVGGIFAVALALLALSGRSFGQVSLDLAAIVAPVIAIVPAPIFTDDVPGLIIGCPGGEAPCVPTAFHDVVDNGMTTLIVTGIVGWVIAVVVMALHRILTVRSGAALLAAAAIIASTAAWWLLAPDSFLRGAHVVAAASFFGFIALAALAAAVGSRRSGATGYRIVYLVIAWGIILDLALLLGVIIVGFTGVVLPEPGGYSLVFIGEAVALGLFAAFWIVQTMQTWRDPDPALRAA